MYSNTIDIFPDDDRNPIMFLYEETSIKGQTEYGKRNILTPEIGNVLLKITVECILKNHDRYWCDSTYYDKDDARIQNKKKIICIYVNIPDEFLEEDTKTIKLDILDDDSNIVNNNITERIFKCWKIPSKCGGPWFCNLYDIYVPIKVEYVKIT